MFPKNPKDMLTIQIDITNICKNKCSNCTRGCGHKQDYYFMDFDTVKKAIDSLKNYKGCVGIMGGEPTLHPNFKEITEYALNSRRNKLEDITEPIFDFNSYAKKYNKHPSKLGLWSSLGESYKNNFELISTSYDYQCLNDHHNNSTHGPLFVKYSDLNISDSNFIKYRNNCWINKNWSASVTNNGVYFCEVAATIDNFLKLNLGRELKNDWFNCTNWNDQLQLCNYCGACLPLGKQEANNETEYCSKFWFDFFTTSKSNKNLYLIDKLEKVNPIKESNPYLKDFSKRFSTSKDLIIGDPWVIIVCVNYSDILKITWKRNNYELNKDKVIIITDTKDIKTKSFCIENCINYIQTNEFYFNNSKFAKGRAINVGINHIKSLDKDAWILHLDADIILPHGYRDFLNNVILNRNILYYMKRMKLITDKDIKDFLKSYDSFLDFKDDQCDCGPVGYHQLFNINANCLKNKEFIYPQKSKSAAFDDEDFWKLFKSDNNRMYQFAMTCHHLGDDRINWDGRKSKEIKE